MPIASYAGLTSGRANGRPVGGKSTNKKGHQTCCWKFCWDRDDILFLMVYQNNGCFLFMGGGEHLVYFYGMIWLMVQKSCQPSWDC